MECSHIADETAMNELLMFGDIGTGPLVESKLGSPCPIGQLAKIFQILCNYQQRYRYWYGYLYKS